MFNGYFNLLWRGRGHKMKTAYPDYAKSVIGGRGYMIERVVRKGQLQDFSEIRENLLFWLSKTPEERIAAVERLRRERDGNEQRLQKVVCVYQRNEWKQ